MRSYFSAMLAFGCCSILSALAMGDDASATSADAGEGASLATLVQQILGITRPTGNFVDELARAISALNNATGKKDIDKAINDLVDTAAKGAKVDSFTPLLLGQLVISARQPVVAKDWRYGTGYERMQLYQYIWNRAVTLSQADPEKAKRFGRAALVLAGHEDMTVGPLEIRIFGRDFPRLVKITQISGTQAKQLQSLISTMGDEAKKGGILMRDTLEAEAAIIENKQRPIPWGLVENSIGRIIEYDKFVNRMQGPRYSDEGEVILAAWELRNLVAAYGDDKSKAAVDAILKDWQAKAKKGSARYRWLEEALRVTGKPLQRSRILGPGKGSASAEEGLRMPNAVQLFRTPLGLTSLGVITAISTIAVYRRPRKKRAS